MRGVVSQRDIGLRLGGVYASWVSDVERGLARARFGRARIREIVDVYERVCAERWSVDPDWLAIARDVYEQAGLDPATTGADPYVAARGLGDAVYAALVGGGGG
jgi:hypothetical protein